MTVGIFQDCSGLVLPTLCVLRRSVALQDWNQWAPLGIPCRPAGWAGGAVSTRLSRPVGDGGGRTKEKVSGFPLRVSSLSLKYPTGSASTKTDFPSCGLLLVTPGDA